MKKFLCLLCCLVLCGCNVKAPESSSSSQNSDVNVSKADTINNTNNTSNINNNSNNNFTAYDTHKPVAGEKSIANLLLTAKQPVGHTMYVWGGGWNEEDTAAGVDATTIGVNPYWAEFASQQTANYDAEANAFKIHNGLDCSGYIGWTLYNVFETENGKEGYVRKAATMAKAFAENGWGTFTPAAEIKDYKAGDVMSMDGHVWLCLGSCDDGSVMLMHSSPPGVRICGTPIDGETSDAILIAQQYMKNFYPEWFEKYPECDVESTYISASDQFRFSEQTLSDEHKLKDMSAPEVLNWIYAGRE